MRSAFHFLLIRIGLCQYWEFRHWRQRLSGRVSTQPFDLMNHRRTSVRDHSEDKAQKLLDTSDEIGSPVERLPGSASRRVKNVQMLSDLGSGFQRHLAKPRYKDGGA